MGSDNWQWNQDTQKCHSGFILLSLWITVSNCNSFIFSLLYYTMHKIHLDRAWRTGSCFQFMHAFSAKVEDVSFKMDCKHIIRYLANDSATYSLSSTSSGCIHVFSRSTLQLECVSIVPSFIKRLIHYIVSSYD